MTTAATRSIRCAAVVVPARDEQDHLPDCLASIQVAAMRIDVPVLVVVVLDRCTDRSGPIARSWPGVLAVETTVGRVGAARGLGAARALAASSVAPHDLWLASTDADSRVHDGWLAHHLHLADTGSDAVLGTVDIAGANADVDELWRCRYRAAVRPDGTHSHVHGANLGLRGSTYLRAGGWPPVAAHEDRRLVAAVRRLGAAVATTDVAGVLTSDRHRGRVPDGVAQDLAGVAAELDQGTAA